MEDVLALHVSRLITIHAPDLRKRDLLVILQALFHLYTLPLMGQGIQYVLDKLVLERSEALTLYTSLLRRTHHPGQTFPAWSVMPGHHDNITKVYLTFTALSQPSLDAIR